jgi:hypothetical protein
MNQPLDLQDLSLVLAAKDQQFLAGVREEAASVLPTMAV